jgi:hypothetical protein
MAPKQVVKHAEYHDVARQNASDEHYSESRFNIAVYISRA